MISPLSIQQYRIEDARVMETLAQLVRRLREDQRLTQTALAERSSVSQGVISRIETGSYKEVPPPEVLDGLAGALGVSVNQLLTASGYHLAESRDQDDPLNNVTFAEFRDLTPEDLDALRVIARRLRDKSR